jgi:murein DD-endopeptidase MepM/ murein hydrolase activator NlpD
MQGDGNLVLYSTTNQALWWTKTGGHTGAGPHLVLQNDGNLVIYTSTGSVLWATYSNTANTTLYPGDVLQPGWVLESADGQFELLMQTDGNLAVYSLFGAHQVIWAAKTNTVGCSSCNHVVMQQTDGNLVVRDASGHALWSSQTWNHGGAYAVLHSGDLVIYDASKQPLWAGVPTSIKNEIRTWFGPNNANVTEWWHESWNGFLEYGTDFGMAPETPLYAVEGGRVLGAGFYGGGGVVSVKAAPGMSESYQHLGTTTRRPAAVADRISNGASTHPQTGAPRGIPSERT